MIGAAGRDLPQDVEFTIKDAGGYGLTGLRERASLLGGTLVLDSGGEGLRVVARLPWAPSSDRGQEVR